MEANGYVGIDVAKEWLAIAARPEGAAWRARNDEAGITELTSQLVERAPRLIVLEATGGLETALAAALTTAKLPVVILNPRQVRDFARATGQLAKTDAIDARVLAQFGEAAGPEPRRSRMNLMAPQGRLPPSVALTIVPLFPRKKAR